jgi:hypothetical protein
MKFRNRVLAVLLAAALCIPAAGCSGEDKSWAVKDSASSVPVGAYIYYLYSAYEEAENKKTDSSKDLFSQQIENKDAKTWIREKALTYTKQLLLLDKKMKELNVTLTDEQKKSASDMNTQAWSQYSSAFEKYGIAQSSFEAAYGNTYEKEQAIFDAVYGKKGTKAVSDEELKSYYTKNYTAFSYMACPLYKTDSNGSYSAMTDAEKKEAKKTFDGYVSQIKAGQMTMEKAADAYKLSMNSTTDVLYSESLNLTTDTNYPDAMKTALKSMQAGEVKAIELTDEQVYVILQKNDAGKTADSKISSDNTRESLLVSYKSGDFLMELGKEADAMTGIEVNEKALNSYDPKMFAS